MPKYFYKDVSHMDPEDVEREICIQKIAANAGLSPKIVDTDWETYIGMEHLGEMCVADMYGDKINKIPKKIMSQIWAIVWTLYWTCDIEYNDVTGYNFIEKGGRVWVIDFGHATYRKKKLNSHYLKDVFNKGTIVKWNPDFV